MAKEKNKLLNIDFQFGIPAIIPSTQEAFKESNFDGATRKIEKESLVTFKSAVNKEIEEQISKRQQFPSKNEIFVCVIQFFNSAKEYASRDIDNATKTILDVLKGKFYVNDSQVRTILASKKIEPRIDHNFAYIAVKELSNDKDIDILKEAGYERAVTLFQELRSKGVLEGRLTI